MSWRVLSVRKIDRPYVQNAKISNKNYELFFEKTVNKSVKQ